MPLYLFFLYFVILKFKWNTFIIILAVALMIIVDDQLSELVKDTIQRLRPSWQPGLMVHMVDAYKGGNYGFYSAHASNTLSIAIFLLVVMGKDYKAVSILAILWSLFMSYTRIYLGVHYPGDILVGWIAGGTIGYLTGKSILFLINHKVTPGKKAVGNQSENL